MRDNVIQIAEQSHGTAVEMLSQGDTQGAANVYRTLANSLDHLSMIQTLQEQQATKGKG